MGQLKPAQISDALLNRMMHSSVGVTVPAEYNAVFREEAGFDERDYRAVPWRKKVSQQQLKDFHVLIVGAGFSGIGMAIMLKAAGIPYTIIEKNPDVGGTWLENRYPGCGVDTPCHFYSYSFAPNRRSRSSPSARSCNMPSTVRTSTAFALDPLQ